MYFDLSPILIVLILSIVFLLILVFYLMLRPRLNSTNSNKPVIDHLNIVGDKIQKLSEGQERLTGGLQTVSEAQAKAQLSMINMMEERLAKVQLQMNENLSHSSRRTAQSLGDLQQRLSTIDKAQEKITKLSGDVLSLQDILSNKQTRGAFGEIQLTDIVSKALPSDGFELQATLSTGKRADCLIKLPNPPGPIVIDSKFPLEAYNLLAKTTDERERKEAERNFKIHVRGHIKDISEKYIVQGETADGALMFLPSEAIYAELHSNFTDLIRESFSLKVWVVSPTTCMATLNTVRAILKDARMKENAERIRVELEYIQKDAKRLEDRASNLFKHFNLASRDLEEIKISSSKISKRTTKFEQIEFDEIKKNELES